MWLAFAYLLIGSWILASFDLRERKYIPLPVRLLVIVFWLPFVLHYIFKKQ